MTSLALKDIASDPSFVLKKYPLINICGRRCNGKTQLAIHLVKNYFSNTPLLVISNNLDNHNHYENLIPTYIDEKTFNNDFDDIINSIKKNNIELTIIFDDICFKKIPNNIEYLILERRNYKINIIITTQYFKAFPKIISNELNYFLMGNIPMNSELRSFHSHYKILDDINKFNILLKQSIKDFNFLLIDTDNLDKLNFIKADINNKKYQLDFNYEKKEKLNNIILHNSIDIQNPDDNYIKLKNKEQKDKYIKIIEDALQTLKELNL